MAASISCTVLMMGTYPFRARLASKPVAPSRPDSGLVNGRLPFENVQAADAVKMSVSCRQREVVFEGQSGDPNVVFRDWCAGLGQIGADATVMFGRRHTRGKHHHGLEEVLHFGQSLGRVRGEMRAANQFTENWLRKVELRAGLDLGVDSPVTLEIGNDHRGVQQDITTGWHQPFRNEFRCRSLWFPLPTPRGSRMRDPMRACVPPRQRRVSGHKYSRPLPPVPLEKGASVLQPRLPVCSCSANLERRFKLSSREKAPVAY